MALVCFIAEIGDRTQITAIALGAANNVWGVWIGGSVVRQAEPRLIWSARLSALGVVLY